MQPVITRSDAYALGQSKYFTGTPCKNKHIAPRYVSTGACMACQRDYMRKYKKPQYGTIRLSVDLHPADYEMVRDFAMAIIEGRNRGAATRVVKGARAVLLAHAATGAAEPPNFCLADAAKAAMCPACGEHRDKPPACTQCGWAAIPGLAGWEEAVAANPALAFLPDVHVPDDGGDVPPVTPARLPLTGPGAAFAARAATGALSPFEGDD